jgi:hypothetical protein
LTNPLQWGILLLLLFVAYHFEKHLKSIASSLKEINTQMQAFIDGASHLGELNANNTDTSFLSRHKLYHWAVLGSRVFSNHGYWFHEHEQQSDKPDATSESDR